MSETSTAKPAVSVIVAVHNVGPFLRRCVDSLLAQTWPSVDIILVDDGSTDTSGDVCDEYALRHPRIHVVHKENGGVSSARNAGLNAAHGEYVAFLDADDWAEANMLEDLVKPAVELDADLVMTGMYVDFEDSNGELTRTEKRIPKGQTIEPGSRSVNVDAELMGLLGYVWNKIYKREILVTLGFEFEQQLSLYEDLVFNEAVILAASRTVMIPKAHVHYIQRSQTSLGTKQRQDFMDLRLRALSCLEVILNHWKVPEFRRDEILVPMYQSAARSFVRQLQADPSKTQSEKIARLRIIRSGPIQEHKSKMLTGTGRSTKARTSVLYAIGFFYLPPWILMALESLRRKS